ncbi:phage infection protein [Virgibacillus pantothenticus]|uniref:Phage infection protein n=1 Tax=Virgibacillus pantothenticus TaxID=1473 RepID=A0A0L0QTJ6_VIRPA|nr:YhgE/Pip domain-containing protein [Virgibacillus pantothenticus]KNE21896.1 phage infection protein [Virgibacillus pantothenticus]MBU8566831.1 YhgE/Pip domain-containing protein [Virgibacillus pantothenticus]MBU8600476.1 YhgE/Pip domain-containing protein [Virgibacillus pantothenticus]MBU8635129.1 YhgE/Pip domain-containing protein [Virgibacillus pantothenticus]MBU8642550.1 YhgE/Pip domain-containing protein [Virgibacillus pantothenticus]
MKNSWRIFFTDIKKVSKNWVAAIIIGGLILLPSFYAWFNIKASWDPYGQTDQIPVGVVNEDQGATVRGQDINVGKDLVKTLKENKKMDWRFTDRKTAMEEVEYGNYFAVIVIPKNFSKRLGTVIEDNPEKANVEYYVNEKINAIAPKITEKGASVIVEQISSQFISTVNGVIFDMFNNLGIELEKDLPDIKRFENYVFEMEEKLPEINDLLNQSLSDANQAQDIVNKAQNLIPDAKEATDNGLTTIDNTTALLKKAEGRLNEMAPKIEQDLRKVQDIANKANNFIQDIQQVDIDFSEGKELANQINHQLDDGANRVGSVIELLEQLKQQNEQSDNNQNEEQGNNPSIDNQQLDQVIERLTTLQEGLTNVKETNKEVIQFIDTKHGDVEQTIGELQQLAENTSTNIDAFVKEYKESIEPTVMAEISRAKNTLSKARGILVDIQGMIPEVERILGSTESNLGEGEDILKRALGEFPYVNSKVKELADRIRSIQGETDINEIIKLLQNDPEAEKGFFAEPVQLNQNKLFPMENYGTGMTPFYTVLAIWVGGLLLISLLATDVHELVNYTERQMYFGRLFTFMGIGFLQTIIVTAGDLLLLGVDAAEPYWFLLFGIFISMIFMLIIYTVVSVFGDVGKAMVIVFLVLQIAGSGGTYPVVLLPEFFQAINPFLPFTYAIDLLREAIGGIVWQRASKDIFYLCSFGAAAIVLGAFLKPVINRHTNKLKEKSKESGLFH